MSLNLVLEPQLATWPLTTGTMSQNSPIHSLHEQAEASFLAYATAETSGGAQVVETYGELESEYASIRTGAILFDQPHRATIRVTGADRVAFLNRMLTQELKTLQPFQSRRSFWLSRKGRIDADIRLIQLPDEMLFDVDILCASKVVETLAEFIFSEDVAFTDITDRAHRLAIHGRRAIDLLKSASQPVSGPPLSDFAPGQATIVKIAGHDVVVDRQDATGDCGLELSMHVEHALGVWNQLSEHADRLNETNAAGQTIARFRPAGWHAFNIARIENGWPIYNLDFGPDSLPAETGVLNDRVSFTKGCYLGQEIVARMHSLGHPKQQLVGLRVSSKDHEDSQWQPITGAAVTSAAPLPPGGETKPVGAVTSSTRSPMLGDDIICLAQVKWDQSQPGTKLRIHTTRGELETSVEPTLTFWKRS